MIVLDASAVLELLLGTAAGGRVRARIERPAESLHAPHLLDVEVASVLRRYERAGTIASAEGERALEHLAMLDLDRHPHDLFLRRVWALRANVTAYDACYLALAEALHAPLLTRDARLASVPGCAARVELV